MRYLLKRNDFLVERTINKNHLDLKKDFKSSSLINETFENDLSWGGSLIGRLINSTLRVLKIYTKTVRVNFIIPQLRKALDDLLTVCRTNEEQRAQLNNLTGQFLLEEIIKVVNSSDSVEQKVAQFVNICTRSSHINLHIKCHVFLHWPKKKPKIWAIFL